MHGIIKIEEEDYPNGHYDHVFFNQCMTTFHDQESSQQIIQNKPNPSQIVGYLTQTIDLCDTPLINILTFVQSNQGFQGIDLDKVRRKIIKQKYILKRNRAKNRKVTNMAVKTEVVYGPLNDQKVEEYKKQRNRISAQISRDRKKEKVRQLQEKNQLLREEYDRMRLQNQRILQQLKATQNNKQAAPDPFKTKWNRLLFILGLMCLFGILQHSLPTQVYSNASKKAQNSQQIGLFSSQESVGFSQEEKAKALADLQSPLKDLFQSKFAAETALDKLKRDVSKLKVPDGLFTSQAKEEIKMAKKIAFM